MDDEKVSLQDDLLAQCLEAMNTLSPDKITPEIDMAIAKVEKYIGHTVEKKKEGKRTKEIQSKKFTATYITKNFIFLTKRRYFIICFSM